MTGGGQSVDMSTKGPLTGIWLGKNSSRRRSRGRVGLTSVVETRTLNVTPATVTSHPTANQTKNQNYSIHKAIKINILQILNQKVGF